MAIKRHKLGPGTLTLGVGGPAAISSQVRSCTVRVTEQTKTTEAIDVLSGESLPEEEEASYKYALAVKFLTDLDADGVTAYTWANRGDTVAMEFTPNTATGGTVEGNVRLVPLDIGGDVKADMEADVTFAGVGDFDFTPAV